MFRRGRVTFIAAGCIAALGAVLLIPGKEVAVADAAAVTDLSSEETIAAIDAMLGPNPVVSAPLDNAPADPVAPIADPNLQTAALETPEPALPATDLEGAPLADPALHPDSIGRQAVNLRAGPSSDTATVTVLQPGQAVQTGESDGGWIEVTLGDGTTGWVYSRYLASVAATVSADAAASDDSAPTAKAVIKGGQGDLEGRTAKIGSALIVRAKPDAGADRIFRTTPGERVKIIDVRGNWLRIRTADGDDGWIERG